MPYLYFRSDCSTLIHTFPHPVPSAPSAITALVQSPAIDVVGIGYLDGTALVFDIRQGEIVMQVKMEDGSCSALSFRMGESVEETYVSKIHHADIRWKTGPCNRLFNRYDSKLGSKQRRETIPRRQGCT